MKPARLIAFDMDGVLIDVSASYRDAVRRTARLFLSRAHGAAGLPDPLFPLPDLALLKQSGGLNNDWDLTAQALSLLFAMVKCPALPEGVLDYEEMITGCDVSDLSAFLADTRSPLAELLEVHGRRPEPLVEAFYRGDVGTGNVIKEIFQEVYLGPDLFRKHYGRSPRFWNAEGLIRRESLLIDPALLADLAQNHVLAIATGRPLAEADHPLDRFGLRRYFSALITLDDCIVEEERAFHEKGLRLSLKKPDPFMLDLVAQRVNRPFTGAYYLGDMPDDMQAARASRTGYRGIGVLVGAAEPEVLRQDLRRAGAEHIIADYGALSGIVA